MNYLIKKYFIFNQIYFDYSYLTIKSKISPKWSLGDLIRLSSIYIK